MLRARATAMRLTMSRSSCGSDRGRQAVSEGERLPVLHSVPLVELHPGSCVVSAQAVCSTAAQGDSCVESTYLLAATDVVGSPPSPSEGPLDSRIGHRWVLVGPVMVPACRLRPPRADVILRRIRGMPPQAFEKYWWS